MYTYRHTHTHVCRCIPGFPDKEVSFVQPRLSVNELGCGPLSRMHPILHETGMAPEHAPEPTEHEASRWPAIPVALFRESQSSLAILHGTPPYWSLTNSKQKTSLHQDKSCAWHARTNHLEHLRTRQDSQFLVGYYGAAQCLRGSFTFWFTTMQAFPWRINQRVVPKV